MDNINHLLIVDDNPEDQAIYKRYIAKNFQQGITIHTIEKGQLALDFLKENKVDCVLLDYQLPDMTGLDFLKKLQEQQDILFPVIMLTGIGNEKVAIEALKSGAYDYLNKGELQPEILYKTIGNAFEKSILTRKIQEKEIEINYLAYHDYLTNIPNRAQFEICAKNALAKAKANYHSFAILFIDLDRFKVVNDQYGHETGDLLLKEVAKRFQPCLQKKDILARLGGDEFAIITDELQESDYANTLANNLLATLSTPLIINDHKIKITPSIGIAFYPDSGQTISKLISNADIALYKAKNDGKNTVRIFTQELSILTQKQMSMERALNETIEQQNFFPCYQPIIDIEKNSLYGMELLLRINNPILKDISIDNIINIANRTGLIIPMGYQIIEKAFQQIAEWQKQNIKGFKVSINLSIRQLEHESWIKTFVALLDKYHIDPHDIIFELIESDVLFNLDEVYYQFSYFTDLGCEIFLDDFGTGYSSLNLIRKLPITGVKIDKSFTKDMENNLSDAKMVYSIILLARELGLTLIVEGIETKTQLDLLKAYPGLKAQGFYFSKPLTSTEVTNNILNQWK